MEEKTKCYRCGREPSQQLASGNYWCSWCGQSFDPNDAEKYYEQQKLEEENKKKQELEKEIKLEKELKKEITSDTELSEICKILASSWANRKCLNSLKYLSEGLNHKALLTKGWIVLYNSLMEIITNFKNELTDTEIIGVDSCIKYLKNITSREKEFGTESKSLSIEQLIERALQGPADGQVEIFRIPELYEKLTQGLKKKGLSTSEIVDLVNVKLLGVCPKCHVPPEARV